MKHKILFVVTYLDTGGISRSLQSLLNIIDFSSYSVDVFAMAQQGSQREFFRNCRLLNKDFLLDALISRYEHKSGLPKLVCAFVKGANKLTFGLVKSIVFSCVARRLSRLENYDSVVAFSEGVPTQLVAQINHPNKIAWIHCDYANYYMLNQRHDEIHLYIKYKSIVNVSRFTMQSFLNIYPSLAGKTCVINNLLDSDTIGRQSLEPVSDFSFDEGKKVIVSVGRIDPVKRFSKIPEIVENLLSRGNDIVWLIIGPPGGQLNEYNLLCSEIERKGLSDRVILLGEKMNPYSYISRATLLVNISISEACPYVINEAKVLHTPVVCTDFGSAKEFITDGSCGFCSSIEEIPDIIDMLLKDDALYAKIKLNLMECCIDNSSTINSIYEVLS